MALIIIGLLVLGTWVRAAATGATNADVDDFAAVYELQPGPDGRRLIAHHLTVGTRLRLVLFLDAVVIPLLLLAALTGTGQKNLMLLVALMVGAGVGAVLITELAMSRPSPTGRRIASLRPRNPSAYVPRLLLWSPLVLAALTVGTLVATQFASYPEPFGPFSAGWGETAPSIILVVLACVGAVLVPVAALLASRWVLTRPQPFVSEDLAAADDALREASVRRIHALASLVLSVGLIAGSMSLNGAYADDGGGSNPVVGLLSWIGVGAAIYYLFAAKRRERRRGFGRATS